MRVVAGSARGRPLQAPPGRATRPTADRVREAVFNALGSLDAVEAARVVDLFAGSGALGIEALSRGAASCTFVERDAAARRVLAANLARTGLTDRATVVGEDVGRFVARPHGPFDLALVDPPYAFDGWSELLAALDADLVVAESDRPLDPGPGWTLVRSKRYGGTVVTFVRRL